MKIIYSEEQLRTLPCYHCIHCIDSKNMVKGKFTKRMCELTKRWGSMYNAFYCPQFENRQQKSGEQTINGYKVRVDQIEDYRTLNQWRESGYDIKKGEEPHLMYSNQNSARAGKLYEYYLPEQVKKFR